MRAPKKCDGLGNVLLSDAPPIIPDSGRVAMATRLLTCGSEFQVNIDGGNGVLGSQRFPETTALTMDGSHRLPR
jgi:hypothetical protein